MKRNEIIGEHKKGVRAVKYNKKPQPHITPQKPKKTLTPMEEGIIGDPNDHEFARRVEAKHREMVEKNPRYAKEHAALNISIVRGFIGSAAENNRQWTLKTASLLQKHGVRINESNTSITGTLMNEGGWGRDSWDSNMPGWQQREQDAWDQGKRAFKRQELEHELGHEEEPFRARRPAYKPRSKGMYFYNVPNGQENKAQEVGLFRTKSGKWYSPFDNTRANMFFGPGRFWQPKESVGENTPGKISNIKPGETATVDHGDGTTTTVDLKKNPTALSKDEQGKLKLSTKPPTGQPQKPDGQEIKPGDQVEIDAQESSTTSKYDSLRNDPNSEFHGLPDEVISSLLSMPPSIQVHGDNPNYKDPKQDPKWPQFVNLMKQLDTLKDQGKNYDSVLSQIMSLVGKADQTIWFRSYVDSLPQNSSANEDLARLRLLAGLNEQHVRTLTEAPTNNTELIKKLQDFGDNNMQKSLPPQGIMPAPAAGAPTAPKTPAPKNAPHQYVPGAKWNAGVLGIGSKGPEVSALQKRLGIADTGVFDNATRDAVIQRQKELGVQADGAWGPGTAQADAAKPKQPATQQPATQQPRELDSITAAPSQSSIAKPTDDVSKSINVAKPGQPPATAANPSAGTAAGATKAIPTAPVNPANPSGRSSQATISPEEAQAVLDNGSPRDIAAFGGKEKLQQIAGAGQKQLPPSSFQKGPAPATTQPPALQKGPAPAGTQPPALQKAKESAELTAMLRIAGLR